LYMSLIVHMYIDTTTAITSWKILKKISSVCKTVTALVIPCVTDLCSLFQTPVGNKRELYVLESVSTTSQEEVDLPVCSVNNTMLTWSIPIYVNVRKTGYYVDIKIISHSLLHIFSFHHQRPICVYVLLMFLSIEYWRSRLFRNGPDISESISYCMYSRAASFVSVCQDGHVLLKRLALSLVCVFFCLNKYLVIGCFCHFKKMNSVFSVFH